MEKIKVAVIGCGTIANNSHIPNYLKSGKAEIVYFCDILPERAQAAVEKYGCGVAVTDYKDVLADPQVEAVSVCTPNHVHAEIAIAALLILMVEPLYLFHIGFQLSFITVLGLCVAAERMEQKKEKDKTRLDWLKESLRFSLYASLFSFPLVAYHFHSVSMVGILANLVIIPLSGILLGFVAAVVPAHNSASLDPQTAITQGEVN